MKQRVASPIVQRHEQVEELGAQKQVASQANLKTIELPEGDVNAINIGWWNNGAKKLDPSDWLSAGYDGVLFKGKGPGKTHIRSNTAWDLNTVVVGKHNGVVAFAGATIHAGRGDAKAKAIHMGTESHSLAPNFELWLDDCELVAHGPTSDNPKRSTWLVFTYQCDVRMRNCVIDGEQLNEHCVYMHGNAGNGARVHACDFRGSGGENFKVTARAHEAVWGGPNVLYHFSETRFSNWHQPWSWRGGAGLVVQGGAGHVFVDQCRFHPRKGHGNIRDGVMSKSLMISAEGNSYDVTTGKVNHGFGNGYIFVRRTAIESSGPGSSNLTNEMMDTGTWGGSQNPAMGYFLQECGFWGKNMIVKPNGQGVPHWGIQGCNTPAIVNAARKHYGMRCENDALYYGDGGPTPVTEDRLYG